MNAPIKLRGTISDRHGIFSACVDMPPRACFQLLLTLADEALASRSSMARLLHEGHPLRATLEHLSSHEALVLLIGLTGVRPGWEQQVCDVPRPASAAPASLSSDKAPQAPSVPAPVAVTTSTGVDFEDGDFEILSGRPG